MIVSHDQPSAKLAEHLRDDEIHVWQMDYASRQGRAPLRQVLAGYLGVPAGAVILVDGEHGRPVLADGLHSSLDFNWSHSGDRAVLAVGRAVVPGIDVERRRPRPRALEIAERYFDPAEAAALADLPEGERDEAFLRLWTAKEAVLKALGRGLAFGLHRLGIAPTPEPLALTYLHGERAEDWQLQSLPLGDEYIGALAWRGDRRRILLGRLASGT